MIDVAPIAIKMTRLFFDIASPLSKVINDHQIRSSYSKSLLDKVQYVEKISTNRKDRPQYLVSFFRSF